MAYDIADLILIPLVLFGLFFFLRWFIRRLVACYRELRDAYYIARRGTLNPIQVRQEFVDTVGREPTVSEVHDLHEMIRAEHKQAVSALLTVGAEIIGLWYLFTHVLHRRG